MNNMKILSDRTNCVNVPTGSTRTSKDRVVKTTKTTVVDDKKPAVVNDIVLGQENFKNPTEFIENHRLVIGEPKVDMIYKPDDDIDKREGSKLGLTTAMYNQEVLVNAYVQERCIRVDASMFRNLVEKHEQRTVLVVWMTDLYQHFGMALDTYAVSVMLLDRYWTRIGSIRRDELQKTAAACMLIANKLEEIEPLSPKSLVALSNKCFSVAELIETEVDILRTFDFHVNFPHPLLFLRRYSRAVTSLTEHHNLAKFIVQVGFLSKFGVDALPSQLAAAALYISRLVFHLPRPWNAQLRAYSPYKCLDEFRGIAADLLITLQTYLSRYMNSNRADQEHLPIASMINLKTLPREIVLRIIELKLPQ